jgi:hypothetical protein
MFDSLSSAVYNQKLPNAWVEFHLNKKREMEGP